MENSPETIADRISLAEKAQVKFIDLQFTDVVGVVKNITIPAHELGESLEKGIWFDGSAIEGFAPPMKAPLSM